MPRHLPQVLLPSVVPYDPIDDSRQSDSTCASPAAKVDVDQ
jgi:hypothetical protein